MPSTAQVVPHPPHAVAAVIPAWNEEGNIGRVVGDIPRDLCPLVIVVDNASTDGTAAVARAAGAIVVAQPRRGYGYACAAGVRAALARGAEIIVFLDGDYSDYPEEMGAVVAPIRAGRADLVLGSRLHPGMMAPGALPAQAAFGNRLIAAIMRVRFGVRITDLAPFHAIRADVLRRLALREMTYGWTVEMIVKAARHGDRIVEVPVHYRRRHSGESKVSGNLQASVRAGARILRVAFRYL